MKAHYFLFLSLLPSLSLLVFGAVALLTPQQPSPSSDRRTNDVERSVWEVHLLKNISSLVVSTSLIGPGRGRKIMSASNCNSSVGAVLRTSRQRKTTNAIGNDVVCITCDGTNTHSSR